MVDRFGDYIEKRKSIRKYDPSELDEQTLDSVRAQISSVVPLFPDVRYGIEIVGKVKGLSNVKAPHYLIFYGEANDKSYQNVGFIGQQMDLFFSSAGIGSCWLGMAKPAEGESGPLPCIIGMAFGKPGESLYRDASEFKRKPAEAVCEGDDKRLNAARLAPSARNEQSWFFKADRGKILCYLAQSAGLIGLLAKKLKHIDIGIAICHLAQKSDGFKFIYESHVPYKKGYIYVGTVI